MKQLVTFKGWNWKDSLLALSASVFLLGAATTEYWAVFNVFDAYQLGFAPAVAACGSNTCTVSVSHPGIPVSASLSVPANVTVNFIGNGSLGIASGQTLTLNGAILAPPSVQIFSGSGAVAGLTRARPEWFGGTTAAAFLAAYNALSSSGGDLLLQLGTYVSPFSQATAAIGTKSGVRFLGSGMGNFNSGGTAVTGGTIIEGQFSINANYVTYRDLCIDDGSAVIAALFGGAIGNGLDMATDGTPYQGIIAQNICALNSSNTAAVHGMLFENVDHLFASNLNTLYGTHGVILKGTHSNIIGIHARGHFSDGLILKADASIPLADSSVSDVHVESFNTSDTGPGGGGVVIDAGTASAAGLTLSGITVRNIVGPCINLQAQTGLTLTDIDISNLICDNTDGNPGVWLTFAGGNIFRARIANAQINNVSNGVRIENGSDETQISNIGIHAATGDCVLNNGGIQTQITAVNGFNCGTSYAVNWVSGSGAQAAVTEWNGSGAAVSPSFTAAAGVVLNGLTLGSTLTDVDFLNQLSETQPVTFTILSAAGSGATTPVCVSGLTCTPAYGQVSFTVGSSPGAGDIFRVNWTSALSHKAVGGFGAVDDNALSTPQNVFYDSGAAAATSCTAFAGTALTATHVVSVTYFCK